MTSVDVIILSWNRLDMTLEAIASARAQQGVQVRLYVIDQGSEAQVCQRLRQEVGADLQLLELGENVGAAEGRNRAIALGQAPYVAGIDNDAVFADEQTLARAVSLLEAEAQTALLAFRILNFYTGLDDWYSWAYPRRQRLQASQSFLTTRFCAAGFMVKRSMLKPLKKPFDPVLEFLWEELDLAYQLIQAGWQVRYEPSVAVRHKVSAEQRHSYQTSRFFFHVRNALYLDYKYYRSWWRCGLKGLGYSVKAVTNGTLGQAWRGMGAAWRLLRQSPPSMDYVLNGGARAYIQRYETAVRGHVWQRLKYDILVRLVKETSYESTP